MSLALLAAAAHAARRIGDADDLEEVTRLALEALDRDLGAPHAMVLLVDEAGTSLYVVRSHGYPEGGAGAEVRVGDGIIGTVARTGLPIRMETVGQALRYSRATRLQAAMSGEPVERQVPLPGLAEFESALAVPMRCRGDLVGVLYLESPRPMSFDEATEHAVSIVGAAVAQQIALIGALALVEDEPPAAPAEADEAPTGHVRAVEFFLADDSVFVDHEYVIKGVAGRILVKVLREHAGGRREFTNRELRLDRWLQLPPIHDNLENRLALLRQRLEEKDFGVRLVRSGRGRFEVVVDGPLRVVERP